MASVVAGYISAGAIVAVGIATFSWWKWRTVPDEDRDSFERFFQGEGRVGEQLTTNNNWGLCFAFANAVWYFAFL